MLAFVYSHSYTSFMKKRIKNINELGVYVQHFIASLPEQHDTALIVKLSGDLGAGKTAFVKEVAKVLGIEEGVTSPTFVIQKEYDISHHKKKKKMIHIDAYRMEDKSELEYLGWKDTISNPQHIIFIEWPEQVSGIALPHAINIHITIVGGDEREIEIL